MQKSLVLAMALDMGGQRYGAGCKSVRGGKIQKVIGSGGG